MSAHLALHLARYLARAMRSPGLQENFVITIETQTRDLYPDAELGVEDQLTVIREVPGAVVQGVHPRLEEEHLLAMPLGQRKHMWNDGDCWRVSIPGWGEGSADRVLSWPVCDSLDPAHRYVLADEDGDVVLRIAT